jgi:hypothetical protein
MPATATPITTAAPRMGTGIFKPGRSLSRPGRGLSRPGRSLSRPGRSLSRPRLGLARPGLGLAGPGRGLSRLGLGLTGAVAVAALALTGCGASQPAGAFAWLHPQPPPQGWTVARIHTGAELAYPPSWRPQHGDPGTATAALLTADGRFLGYLNLTPQQGGETMSNWASFRIGHNADDGDRSVQRLSAATGLRFRTGRGSCVKDSYVTEIGAHFIEIACLVSGSRAESVVVGAAPPDRWSQASAVIERAIEGVRT